MARNKIDQLTQDAIAASRCGMSYGRFKGLEYEQIQSGKRHAPKIEKQLQPARRTFDLVCQVCGLEFTAGSRLKKYCCDQCKGKADRMNVKKKKETTEEEQKKAALLYDLPPIGGIHS